MSTLFQVTFPEDHEIATVHEFERADASIKGELWYFAKELKMLWRVPQRRIGLLQAFMMPWQVCIKMRITHPNTMAVN